MQINFQQLPQRLKGALLPIYLIAGDVPLLRSEAHDAIRQAAQRQGYQHRERLEVETGFNWMQLPALANTYQLFAEQTLLELHNPAAKFDVDAGKILLAYCEAPPADKILLIISGKLSSAQQKTRWFKRILECGAFIPIWPIKAQELPQWIQARLRQANVHADTSSIQMLAEYTEGNLLATQQAISRLQLLHPGKTIGVAEMSDVISDSAQFNVFELSAYLLRGDSRGAVRVLQHLRATDTEPTLTLWLLARECRELLNMAEQLQRGQSLQAVVAAQWSNLQPLYQSALRRLTVKKLKQLLLACQETDQVIKGMMTGQVWPALTRIGLGLTESI